MRLIDELQDEHRVIEEVGGALLTFAARPAAARPAGDGEAFVRFFRLYASHFHHAREEDTLFAALRDRAGLPADRGPIAVMITDHARMAGLLDAVEADLGGGASHEARLRESAAAYVHALWHHIDAENSVLFPECEPRLRRNGVSDLPSRGLTADESEALGAGRQLLARYPPTADAGIIRGDGCIMCPAFGVTCRGLEREWWNEWEWDEFEDRMGGV